MRERAADVLVVGGGLGGVAAAMGAARMGRSVILTEVTDWLGGQLTTQAVPPDEHPWIEGFGCTASYRRLRDGIRDYYRRWYPLTASARGDPHLNPGAGRVGPLCHEPRVAVAVIDALLAPYRSSGRLDVRLRHRPVAVEMDGDRVLAVVLEDLDQSDRLVVTAPFVLDATETGELLPLSGVEYVSGFEAQSETGEPHAPQEAQPLNMQAFSVCFAVDHLNGEDHTIDRPAEYERWRRYQPPFWPDRLLSWTAPSPRTLGPVRHTFVPNPDAAPLGVIADQRRDPGDADLWLFRRIAARLNFEPGTYASDVTLVNWPMIDYFEGPIIEVDEATATRHLESARQLSLSALYWLQTEAPRPDGGTGYPGLRLRGDVVGTDDGLAKAPYIRESRRIRAEYTVVEQDVASAAQREHGPASYRDSVGIGSYRIDLHPSTGGDNYIDVAAWPFEIPLGALLPVRVTNLLAAAKNIGTTHITNGCYRMHPTEWNVGEAAGLLAGFCLTNALLPSQVRADGDRLQQFQDLLQQEGIELHWPREVSAY